MTRKDGAMSPERIARDAARTTVTHVGPTADRTQNALLRYLSVAAASATQGQPPELASRPAPTAVRDVMTVGVVTAYEQAPFKEIVAALSRNRISTVPVVDAAHRVIGVVSESDLLARISHARGPTPHAYPVDGAPDAVRKTEGRVARDLMTSPAIVVNPHTSIEDAAALAGRMRLRWLPVVDADGVLCGAVSRADLLRVFLRPDADILREINTHVLRRPAQLTPAEVTAVVDEGVVTLLGEVEFASAKRRIVTAVHAIAGVVDVENLIRARIDDSVTTAIVQHR